MNSLKKSTDNYFPTILCIVLAFFLLAFASNEKKKGEQRPNSSICLTIDIQPSTQAVVPTPTDIPMCASFTDDNNIILNQPLIKDYSNKLKVDFEFTAAKEKHLKIKPLFNRVVRRLIFSHPESSDFKAIC